MGMKVSSVHRFRQLSFSGCHLPREEIPLTPALSIYNRAALLVSL